MIGIEHFVVVSSILFVLGVLLLAAPDSIPALTIPGNDPISPMNEMNPSMSPMEEMSP